MRILLVLFGLFMFNIAIGQANLSVKDIQKYVKETDFNESIYLKRPVFYENNEIILPRQDKQKNMIAQLNDDLYYLNRYFNY